jgi:hypothetical protein
VIDPQKVWRQIAGGIDIYKRTVQGIILIEVEKPIEGNSKCS